MELKLVARDYVVTKGYSTRVYLKNGKKYIDPSKVSFSSIGCVSVGDNGFVIAYEAGETEIFATYRKVTVSIKLMVQDERKPLYVGHRGAQPRSVEEVSIPNTVLGFKLGASRDTYGIETDLRISPEHVFYLHHDSVVTTTPMNFLQEELDQEGILIDTDINTVPYEKIKNLHPYWLNGERMDQTNVALFQDYINLCKETGKKLILELKSTNGINPTDQSFIGEVVEWIKKDEVYENTIFITFVQEAAQALRDLYKDAEIQLLTGPNTTTQAAIDWCKENEASIDAVYTAMTDDFIKQIHESYLYVNVWTVNNQSVADELINRGVDIITSDKLDGR